MKTFLLAASLFLAARSAHAMHAYATDTCVGMSLNGRQVAFGLSNDVPSAPHRLNVDGGDSDATLWVSTGADTDDQEPSLTLRKLSENKTGSRNVGDECFVGKGYTSVRKFRVEAIKKNAADATDLKKGDVVYFSCYTDHQEPSGAGCDKQ